MTDKTPMKIMYLITKSNFGGAQKYVFELAVAAKATGHDVSVACGGAGGASAPAGKLVAKLDAQHILHHHIKNFRRDMSVWQDIKAGFEVLLLLIKERPDVLHVTSSKAGGIGALAGRLVGIKRIIFTSHGLTVDEIWRPQWQRFLIYVATWITLRLSHHSIMISTETYKRAQAMPGMKDRVSLVKNGIADITFLERAEARKAIAPVIPDKAIWIGGIGELHPNKNWSGVIRAMSQLPKQAQLLIIGEGEERLQLEELINELDLTDRVHLLGYLEAPQYLKAFDIFVLPSKKEGLPYVLLEAGLAGLATVASDLPGNHDIISTGETGFLVEPTPNNLVASLEILVRDEGMRKSLGQALQQKINNEFSVKTMYQKTFALY